MLLVERALDSDLKPQEDIKIYNKGKCMSNRKINIVILVYIFFPREFRRQMHKNESVNVYNI